VGVSFSGGGYGTFIIHLVTLLSEPTYQIVFFIWRHLDAFISLQDYLDNNPPPERPVYNQITSGKAKDAYQDAYNNTGELLKSMKEAKLKKSVSAGLWPLDVHSYNDWRTTTHFKKVYTEYIIMARIEISIVNSYRPSLFQQSPAAAFIRQGIASLLSDACKLSLINPDPKHREKRQVRQYIFADKIPCDLPSAPLPPSVDVLNLKHRRQRAAHSKALAADAVAVLKKVEALKASTATPRTKDLDRTVAKAVKFLKHVSPIFIISYNSTDICRPFGIISAVCLLCKRLWKTTHLLP
jgi:hypothetical protein